MAKRQRREPRNLGPYPGGAYHCESCPLPAADPGPDLRAVVTLWQELTTGPQALRDIRWRRLEQTTAPERIDALLSDLATVDAVVVESRQAQSEYDRQVMAALAEGR